MGVSRSKEAMAGIAGISSVENAVTRHHQQSFPPLFSLFTAAAFATFLLCSIIGLANGIWQVTLVGITTLSSLLFGYSSQLFARRKRRAASEIMAILGFILAFAVPNLFWTNATFYYILGGSLIILISGALLSTRWTYRVIALLAFIAAALIFSNAGWFPRYDIQDSRIISFLLPAITLLILLGALWQVFQSLQLSTIRSRLLAGFIFVAVIPLVISAAVSGVIGSKTTIDSAVNLLTAVSTLKEQSLAAWLGNLQQLLHSEYLRDQAQQTIPRLLNAAPESQEFKFNHGNLSARLNSTITTRKEFAELFILNKQGQVIFSTIPGHEGMDLSGEEIFTKGLSGPYYLLSFNRPEFEQTGVVVGEPVIDQDGKTLGVLAGFTGPEQINKIMQEDAGIGRTGETFLVDSNYTLLTPSIYPGYDPYQSDTISRGTVDAVVGRQSGFGAYNNYGGQKVIGVYRWLPEMNVALLAEQSREEVFAPTFTTIAINFVVSVILIIGTILFAVAMSNSISRPITELTRATQRVADGELELSASVGERKDEIAILAASFNKMTDRLRIVISGLEDLVKFRTRQLEIRSDQIQVAAQLGSAATSILNTEQLIRQVVQMILAQFELNYVGLFLVDESGEYAILRAGTGEGERFMLESGHRIKIGEKMIGRCIQNGQPQFSQIAMEESSRSPNAEPPETHSEAAVPLRSRGLVLGAISVQSLAPNAFDESSLLIYQTLADQVAIALDNARLFAEAQSALETTRQAYGELSRQAWIQRLGSRAVHVARSPEGLWYQDSASQRGNGKLHGSNGDKKQQPDEMVELPLEVRGTVIGTLRAKKAGGKRYWSREEQDLLATLSEQLAVALDSARLFEETLIRAERERLISDITNRVRETLDIDTVLKTAAKEMQKALDLEEVEVRMNKPVYGIGAHYESHA